MVQDEELLKKRIATLTKGLASYEKREQEALAGLGRALLPIASKLELGDTDRQLLTVAQEAHDACANQRKQIEEAERVLEELRQSSQQGPRLCPKCHTEILPGDAFCAGCGTKVSDLVFPEKKAGTCPQCKSPVKPDMKFCPACGTPLRSQ